ncbi:MAG: hypothetical protein U0231_14540 [Nitrospiraceae bacterium]
MAIAEQVGARVFVRAWPGYGPQKNFRHDQGFADWILIVDADERVIRFPAARDSDIAGDQTGRRRRRVRDPPETSRSGSKVGIYLDYQLRLFRKSSGRYDDVRARTNI